MKLPAPWEKFLTSDVNLKQFYRDLRKFLKPFATVIPARKEIFHVFDYLKPEEVKVVLLGEDPYPRLSSACGVAFWDQEITTWDTKTRGSSLKNILKALLIYKKLATYDTSIAECREIAQSQGIKSPPKLFEHWLEQGVLLLNTALTYSSREDKGAHFSFWHPFLCKLLAALNRRAESPYYILWGGKAARWEQVIRENLDGEGKIIRQGHPTFVHQFLNPQHPAESPFQEIASRIPIQWL